MRAALLLVIAVTIAFAALQLGNVSDRVIPRVDIPENSDYYLRGAVVRQMNLEGNMTYRMKASETLHYPDDTARLTDIDVHYLGGEQDSDDPASGEWFLQADRGHVPPGQEEIFLQDNVEATMKREKSADIHVKTDQVWVRPAQNRIETEARVTASSSGRKIEGTGMTVFLEDDRVELHNDVRVRYEP